jgi:hypothetical protein
VAKKQGEIFPFSLTLVAAMLKIMVKLLRIFTSNAQIALVVGSDVPSGTPRFSGLSVQHSIPDKTVWRQPRLPLLQALC